ncbi:hypothetical protein QPK87_03965 [Kamptonema cortianum]|nr:hypothetical protein [Kamptonema cortianum]
MIRENMNIGGNDLVEDLNSINTTSNFLNQRVAKSAISRRTTKIRLTSNRLGDRNHPGKTEIDKQAELVPEFKPRFAKSTRIFENIIFEANHVQLLSTDFMEAENPEVKTALKKPKKTCIESASKKKVDEKLINDGVRELLLFMDMSYDNKSLRSAKAIAKKLFGESRIKTFSAQNINIQEKDSLCLGKGSSKGYINALNPFMVERFKLLLSAKKLKTKDLLLASAQQLLNELEKIKIKKPKISNDHRTKKN